MFNHTNTAANPCQRWWLAVLCSGRQISVGPDGAPWVINRDGDIYRGWGY